jgi:hypothetical protein
VRNLNNKKGEFVMRKMLLCLMSFVFIAGLSSNLFAQWAQNKYAREDALYAKELQAGESITVDGIEDAVWAEADSVVVGYNQTDFLPSSGYNLGPGNGYPAEDDSANAVVKFLYKAPYLYILMKSRDKSVGGWEWDKSDAVIMSFKDNTGDHSWSQAWDKRIEHFYTRMYHWAFPDSFSTPPVGAQPLFMGNNAVGGGMDDWRTPAQKERWMAVTTVQGGTANDTLPDAGWITEHRIDLDSLGFNVDRMGCVMPFSFSLMDGDRFLDTDPTNNGFSKTWWGCEWNENWYYSAIFIDPTVTTASPAGMIPPEDYVVPHLNAGDMITVDGDLSDWNTSNALHFHMKYGDESGFNMLRGTGAWSSGYQQIDVTGLPTPPPLPPVLDSAEVDYWLTFDDENLYVGAQISDKIVTVPYHNGRKDGITFFMASRNYVNGNGILPARNLTVNVDSAGNAQAGDDLVGMADTGNVSYALMLGSQTTIHDPNDADNGFFVEMKIPFATLGYPANLGDSVLFIGALVNDMDIQDDSSANYFDKAWWFQQQAGQHCPSWSVLGPAGAVGINQDADLIPNSIKLFDNYPNPFNPTTTIQYTVSKASNVSLYIYDVLGQTISVMHNTNVPAGTAEFRFNGRGLSSGVYFYQLKITNLSDAKSTSTKVKKMVLLK